MPPDLIDLILKGGNVGALVAAAIVMYKLGGMAWKIIKDGDLVPKLYYIEKVNECNRLRSENDAYRSITLRAVGVVESSVKREG